MIEHLLTATHVDQRLADAERRAAASPGPAPRTTRGPRRAGRVLSR
ncbi:hypothetical protein [Conexibacter sp. SYSU D00693]|nr:hypothetical protein [Conexibacter sp. SYSU D00693]